MVEARYWLYKDEFTRHVGSIDKEEPVELEIMDQTEKLWKMAKVLLLKEPAKGSEVVGLLGPFGEPSDQGRYHIKVLEILPSPLDD